MAARCICAHNVFVGNSDLGRDCVGVDREVAQQGSAVSVVREPVGDGRAAGSEAAEVVAALRLGLVQAGAGVPAVLDRLIGTERLS
jgi:hypothetical protein